MIFSSEMTRDDILKNCPMSSIEIEILPRWYQLLLEGFPINEAK